MSSTPTNPYAAAHLSPNGEGDARPTALQIIHDENLVNKMQDKVMLVTGASSGIGAETARALHATGAHVFIQVRDVPKGEAVMRDILASSEGTGKLELIKMDLDSLASVRAGVEEFLKRASTLNVLVNNAGELLVAGCGYANLGVRNPPESRTQDGFETQFGVNHLSHFLLFQLLKPTLLASSTPEFASRVVNVSSGAHSKSAIHFENLNLEGIYTPALGYAQSKTANILMANEVERLYGSKGIHGLSVHPGGIRSGAQRHDDPAIIREQLQDQKLMKILKNTAQGAATTVWAAVGKVWEGKGGKYLENMREGVEVETADIYSGGYKSFAFDQEAQRKLWEVSCKLVGVSE
ncbi:MAG: hypothetical protein M1834_008413 [Cirrosporium novae-zelandiae]|nr:MAG: hypothetical protein M1834_008413 [Cirrosporium novae-zelandiae]